MSSPANRWRAPIIGAVTGLIVAAAFVGTAALASGGGTPTTPSATTTAPASGIDCAPGAAGVAKTPGGPSSGPGPAPFLAAVAQLVQAGTINQAQARVIDADVQAGRVDPDQLVANGTLTQAQADTVMARLGAVKRSLAPGGQPSADAQAAARKRAHH